MAKDLIKTIVDQVNDQLVDDGFVRWPKAKLIEAFNDAQRAIVLIRPDANVVEADLTCVVGTKQTLPEDGIRLVDVRSNQAGNAIKYRKREEIVELYPDWYSTKDSIAEAFMYDERQPKRFFLFPGVADQEVIEIVYSQTPPLRLESDYDAGKADLDNIYSNAIVEYMLYKAHSKDFEYSEQAKAQTHYQMFSAIMGMKSEADVGMTPTNKE